MLHSFFLNALPLHTKEYSFTSVIQCIHVGSTTLTSLLSTATGKVLRVIPEGQLQYCSGGRWGGDGGVVACCNRIPSQRIVEVCTESSLQCLSSHPSFPIYTQSEFVTEFAPIAFTLLKE